MGTPFTLPKSYTMNKEVRADKRAHLASLSDAALLLAMKNACKQEMEEVDALHRKVALAKKQYDELLNQLEAEENSIHEYYNNAIPEEIQSRKDALAKRLATLDVLVTKEKRNPVVVPPLDKSVIPPHLLTQPKASLEQGNAPSVKEEEHKYIHIPYPEHETAYFECENAKEHVGRVLGILRNFEITVLWTKVIGNNVCILRLQKRSDVHYLLQLDIYKQEGFPVVKFYSYPEAMPHFYEHTERYERFRQ